jgi:hypothetical protein
MDNESNKCALEFGRIIFRSWEHDWNLGIPHERTSLAEARRLLPTSATQPVYDWLNGLEAMLRRRTLPFPPFDVRVRRQSEILENGDGPMWRALPIRCLCPDWDEYLRAAGLMDGDKGKMKRGKHGSQISVLTGESILGHAYSLNWEKTPDTYALHDVLREFSPHFKERTIFDGFGAIRSACRDP